ncbi:MAG: phosphotransferase [Clostridiales bacterium]|jgi:GTP:adenosylcobinamide-phosphate guanylyltransferase|nr:phosphotransferase [Clostridiales bacterium]
MALKVKYIVVQAGGKGLRLGHLTQNKPKALVPAHNLPMLFHLFKKYPDKLFLVIADYKKDVMRKYLDCFAEVKYKVIDASGTGTCSGIKQALRLIPDEEPFMLVWSDLILSENFEIPKDDGNYIGISQTFSCRWSYQNGSFAYAPSDAYGVAGLFIFKCKAEISDVPESGEFVQWLQAKGLLFKELGLAGTKEFGILSEYEKLEQEKCRPFNRITSDGNGILTKEGIDEQGRRLAQLEAKWYEQAGFFGVENIPKIYQANPIKMELIPGISLYDCHPSRKGKKEILLKLSNALKNLHAKKQEPADPLSLYEAYYMKTMGRLSKIRDLVPFADQKTIKVNEKECRNVFYFNRDLERKLEALKCESFAFIHGDCTFSNIILKNGLEPVLIDPRGYFGCTEIYGDPLYDWAKLYYSLSGNYDRFNLKDFKLAIAENSVNLKIGSNKWEDMEQDFFDASGANPDYIKLVHAVIWLSLTTYAWQDYDSICGAFYNGLYHLEDVL